MTHLDEIKMWLKALNIWRLEMKKLGLPSPPKMPPSVETWLMDQAMALDDTSRE